jgi:hypothetical protein
MHGSTKITLITPIELLIHIKSKQHSHSVIAPETRRQDTIEWTPPKFVHLVFESPIKSMHIVFDNNGKLNLYLVFMVQKWNTYLMKSMYHESEHRVIFLHTYQTM